MILRVFDNIFNIMMIEFFLFILIILWLFASITFWMMFRKWLRSSPPARQTVSTDKLNSNPSGKLLNTENILTNKNWLNSETTFFGVRLLTYFYLSYCLPTENVKLDFSVAKATLQLQMSPSVCPPPIMAISNHGNQPLRQSVTISQNQSVCILY